MPTRSVLTDERYMSKVRSTDCPHLQTSGRLTLDGCGQVEHDNQIWRSPFLHTASMSVHLMARDELAEGSDFFSTAGVGVNPSTVVTHSEFLRMISTPSALCSPLLQVVWSFPPELHTAWRQGRPSPSWPAWASWSCCLGDAHSAADLSRSGGWLLATHQMCWCGQTCVPMHPSTPSSAPSRTCTWASRPSRLSSLRRFHPAVDVHCRTAPEHSLLRLPCRICYRASEAGCWFWSLAQVV